MDFLSNISKNERWVIDGNAVVRRAKESIRENEIGEEAELPEVLFKMASIISKTPCKTAAEARELYRLKDRVSERSQGYVSHLKMRNFSSYILKRHMVVDAKKTVESAIDAKLTALFLGAETASHLSVADQHRLANKLYQALTSTRGWSSSFERSYLLPYLSTKEKIAEWCVTMAEQGYEGAQKRLDSLLREGNLEAIQALQSRANQIQLRLDDPALTPSARALEAFSFQSFIQKFVPEPPDKPPPIVEALQAWSLILLRQAKALLSPRVSDGRQAAAAKGRASPVPMVAKSIKDPQGLRAANVSANPVIIVRSSHTSERPGGVLKGGGGRVEAQEALIEGASSFFMPDFTVPGMRMGVLSPSRFGFSPLTQEEQTHAILFNPQMAPEMLEGLERQIRENDDLSYLALLTAKADLQTWERRKNLDASRPPPVFGYFIPQFADKGEEAIFREFEQTKWRYRTRAGAVKENVSFQELLRTCWAWSPEEREEAYVYPMGMYLPKKLTDHVQLQNILKHWTFIPAQLQEVTPADSGYPVTVNNWKDWQTYFRTGGGKRIAADEATEDIIGFIANRGQKLKKAWERVKDAVDIRYRSDDKEGTPVKQLSFEELAELYVNDRLDPTAQIFRESIASHLHDGTDFGLALRFCKEGGSGHFPICAYLVPEISTPEERTAYDDAKGREWVVEGSSDRMSFADLFTKIDTKQLQTSARVRWVTRAADNREETGDFKAVTDRPWLVTALDVELRKRTFPVAQKFTWEIEVSPGKVKRVSFKTLHRQFALGKLQPSTRVRIVTDPPQLFEMISTRYGLMAALSVAFKPVLAETRRSFPEGYVAKPFIPNMLLVHQLREPGSAVLCDRIMDKLDAHSQLKAILSLDLQLMDLHGGNLGVTPKSVDAFAGFEDLRFSYQFTDGRQMIERRNSPLLQLRHDYLSGNIDWKTEIDIQTEGRPSLKRPLSGHQLLMQALELEDSPRFSYRDKDGHDMSDCTLEELRYDYLSGNIEGQTEITIQTKRGPSRQEPLSGNPLLMRALDCEWELQFFDTDLCLVETNAFIPHHDVLDLPLRSTLLGMAWRDRPLSNETLSVLKTWDTWPLVSWMRGEDSSLRKRLDFEAQMVFDECWTKFHMTSKRDNIRELQGEFAKALAQDRKSPVWVCLQRELGGRPKLTWTSKEAVQRREDIALRLAPRASELQIEAYQQRISARIAYIARYEELLASPIEHMSLSQAKTTLEEHLNGFGSVLTYFQRLEVQNILDQYSDQRSDGENGQVIQRAYNKLKKMTEPTWYNISKAEYPLLGDVIALQRLRLEDDYRKKNQPKTAAELDKLAGEQVGHYDENWSIRAAVEWGLQQSGDVKLLAMTLKDIPDLIPPPPAVLAQPPPVPQPPVAPIPMVLGSSRDAPIGQPSSPPSSHPLPNMGANSQEVNIPSTQRSMPPTPPGEVSPEQPIEPGEQTPPVAPQPRVAPVVPMLEGSSGSDPFGRSEISPEQPIQRDDETS